MQSDSKEFEVLLEVDKSSRILKVTPDTLLVAVESELGKIGLDISLLPFYATKESLVRPHLEYASAIWSPYLQKDKILLEKVQKFALRMVTKHWDFNYDALLDVVSIDSLESRREEACLCLLYKIINNICYFDSDVFTFSNTRSYHSHSLTLCIPFSRTNSYMYSFVPNTINTWNRLDLFIVSAPSLPSFKFRLLHS